MAMDKTRRRDISMTGRKSHKKSSFWARVHIFQFLNDGIHEEINLGSTSLETGIKTT
jgi:hypothetical protein